MNLGASQIHRWLSVLKRSSNRSIFLAIFPNSRASPNLFQNFKFSNKSIWLGDLDSNQD